MVTGLAARLFLAVVVVVAVVGNFGGHSFAADKARALELSKALGQAKLFAGLTDKERAALESAATLRHCQEGERIIEQGKHSGRMFIVLEGRAEVRVNGKLVATLPEQSLVGEVEFLDTLPASADVIILKETRLIELNHAALTSLMKKQTRLGYVLMGEIARIEGQRLRAMNPKQRILTDVEKEAIKKEVKDQFKQFVSALNQKDAVAWSEFYSRDDFLSAIAGTDHYAKRGVWVDLITNYFSMRERQHVEPLEIRVTPLTPNLALMTSEEKSEMGLKSGKNSKSKHVFTMIWKKEQNGWKILHSHESWMDES